jgi:hypothetical protein
VRHLEAHLDHASALGVDYAQAWAQRVGGFNPPIAGVLRRALALYMQHLDRLPPAARQGEFVFIKSACTALRTDEQDREAASVRLQAAIAAEAPLPPFAEVMRPGAAAARAAFDDRVEEVLSVVAQSNRRWRAVLSTPPGGAPIGQEPTK